MLSGQWDTVKLNAIQQKIISAKVPGTVFSVINYYSMESATQKTSPVASV